MEWAEAERCQAKLHEHDHTSIAHTREPVRESRAVPTLCPELYGVQTQPRAAGHKIFVVHGGWHSESHVAPPPPAVSLFQHCNAGTALDMRLRRLLFVGLTLPRRTKHGTTINPSHSHPRA